MHFNELAQTHANGCCGGLLNTFYRRARVMRREQPWRTNRSRTLRSNAPTAERILWSKVRNRQIEGFKFVRQFPVGPYFADFACRDSMLIVEVDGDTHHTGAQRAYDAERDMFMRRAGYRVLRFSNWRAY